MASEQDLLNSYYQMLGDQKSNLASLKNQLAGVQEQKPIDFTPLASYVDSVYKTNHAARMQPLLSPQDKANLVAGYQKLVSNQQDELATNQLKLMAMMQEKNLQNQALMARSGAGSGSKLTPGQKKLDETFAKNYEAQFTSGGYADVQKGIKQLEEVSNDLANKKGLTGPVIGKIPMYLRTSTNPESAAAQQTVEEVVQRNLRSVLGAQFTEREGTRLIQRSYDPSLSQEENKKRLDRLITQIKEAADAKYKAGKYFEENGTLREYPGTALPSMSSFNVDRDPSSENQKPDFANMTTEQLAQYIQGN
jgi:hypothetical protein